MVITCQIKVNGKKSLFWINIQAQSSVLHTLTSTSPGHWAISFRIYPSGYPSQLPGEYTAAHMQLGTTAYKSVLTCTRLLLGREKQCSMKCLAQRPNELEHRQGMNPGLDLDLDRDLDLESCTLPLDQLMLQIHVADIMNTFAITNVTNKQITKQSTK